MESRGFGGDGGGVTPVPIPNTEVKPACADGTWTETSRESRSPPISHDESPRPRLGALSRPASVRREFEGSPQTGIDLADELGRQLADALGQE